MAKIIQSDEPEEKPYKIVLIDIKESVNSGLWLEQQSDIEWILENMDNSGNVNFEGRDYFIHEISFGYRHYVFSGPEASVSFENWVKLGKPREVYIKHIQEVSTEPFEE